MRLLVSKSAHQLLIPVCSPVLWYQQLVTRSGPCAIGFTSSICVYKALVPETCLFYLPSVNESACMRAEHCSGVAGDSCSAGPCQSGGTCTVTGSSYSCTCPAGYTGANCQYQACSQCRSMCDCNTGNNVYSLLLAKIVQTRKIHIRYERA